MKRFKEKKGTLIGLAAVLAAVIVICAGVFASNTETGIFEASSYESAGASNTSEFEASEYDTRNGEHDQSVADKKNQEEEGTSDSDSETPDLDLMDEEETKKDTEEDSNDSNLNSSQSAEEKQVASTDSSAAGGTNGREASAGDRNAVLVSDGSVSGNGVNGGNSSNGNSAANAGGNSGDGSDIQGGDYADPNTERDTDADSICRADTGTGDQSGQYFCFFGQQFSGLCIQRKPESGCFGFFGHHRHSTL